MHSKIETLLTVRFLIICLQMTISKTFLNNIIKDLIENVCNLGLKL